MNNRQAIGVLAGLVLVVGFILAVVSTSVSDDVDCGSAFSPSTTGATAAEFGEAIRDIYAGGTGDNVTDYDARCEDRISTQRMIAFPIMGVGGLALLFLLLTTQWKTEPNPDLEAAPSDAIDGGPHPDPVNRAGE